MVRAFLVTASVVASGCYLSSGGGEPGAPTALWSAPCVPGTCSAEALCVDAPPLAVATGRTVHSAAVAAVGGRTLVAYDDQGGDQWASVVYRWIERDGSVGPGIVLGEGATSHATLAPVGGGVLVSYWRGFYGTRPLGPALQRIDEAGNAFEAIFPGSETYDAGTRDATYRVPLALGGPEVALAWPGVRSETGTGVDFATVSASLRETGTTRQLARHTNTRVELVWDGDGYAAVWGSSDRAGVAGPLSFARFDATGEPRDEPAVLSESADDWSMPSLVWTGEDYAVAVPLLGASGDRDVWLLRVRTDGTTAAPVRVSRGLDACCPSLSWTGDGFALAWMQGDQQFGRVGLLGRKELYLQRLAPDGEPLAAPLQVTRVQQDPERPLESLHWGTSLAIDGDGFVLAWSQEDLDGTLAEQDERVFVARAAPCR